MYKITHGKTIKYVLDDDEFNEYVATLPNKNYEMQRFKGLGEMNAAELKETTMSKENRILRKITVEDTMAADKIFETLMGEEVAPRREFIEERAGYVTNLDV